MLDSLGDKSAHDTANALRNYLLALSEREKKDQIRSLLNPYEQLNREHNGTRHMLDL